MDHETSEKEAVGSGSTSDKFPVWQHAGRPMQTKAVERLRRQALANGNNI